MGKKTKAKIVREYKHNGNTFQKLEIHEHMENSVYEYQIVINGKVALRRSIWDECDYGNFEHFYDGAVQSYKILNGII